MSIKKLLIRNYKLISDAVIELNDDINIFVGENDSGKSTILEALSIVTTGKLNGYAFDKQVKANCFNNTIRSQYVKNVNDFDKVTIPPSIIIEAYTDFEDQKYAGTNNELHENCVGLRVEVNLDKAYENDYKEMLFNKEIYDIPVELYSVSYKYFNGDKVLYRFSPLKALLIDTTRKDYSYIVDRFVSDNITTYLSSQDQTNLSIAYRKSRHSFRENETVQSLNEYMKRNMRLNDKEVIFDIREDEIDEWKHQMSIMVDEIPFENIGFGSQNTIKIGLAIKNSSEKVNVILMEEPENNLSYTNMVKLINHIVESEGKQSFISTHSSYIANKMNLGKLFLMRDGRITSLAELPEETKKYFIKLPGYDTLRVVLAEKVILVEGPTDELILQRAYYDKKGRLPIDDGIDIIVVDSLAFKRYCDIAILLNKKVVIVTDNDGDINKSIKKKYNEYLNHHNLIFIYEMDTKLRTIEPSVLEANCDNDVPSKTFKTAISKNRSMMPKNKADILKYMKDNKVEWAFRVFDSNEKIVYPEYIENAIKQFD